MPPTIDSNSFLEIYPLPSYFIVLIFLLINKLKTKIVIIYIVLDQKFKKLALVSV